MKKLKILNLDVSLDWVLFIAYNRGKLEEFKDTELYKKIASLKDDFDLIVGPIADNRMFDTIDDFLNNAITSIQAIHAIKDLSLGKQYLFRTKKALNHLVLIDRLYVSKIERKEAKEQKIQKIKNCEEYISKAYKDYIRQGEYIVEIFNK